MLVWAAGNDVREVVERVRQSHHVPRLAEANIAISFNDGKSFVDGRFNWGKTAKFSPLAKIWHPKDRRYDFHISLPADPWHSILNAGQREAWIDLHVTRCQVEYVPVSVEENGKKKPVKDEWGRTQYTDEIRRDEDGSPKWKLSPWDLSVYQENVLRYGCWCQDLLDFRSAIQGRKTESGLEP